MKLSSLMVNRSCWRKPEVRWDKLYFGPIGDGTLTSLRIAQQLPGLGLLEAVSETDYSRTG